MMGGAGGVPIVASKCAQAACQDFEADLDPAVWSTSFSGGAIKVVKDAVTALHGTGSSLQLHLLKNPVEGAVKAFVTLKTVPDAVKNGGGDLYARFYTYFSVSHDSRHT